MFDTLVVNKFSQLVYLDLPGVLRGGKVTVGNLADFYNEDPVGQEFLKARFGAIEREYALWKSFLRDELEDVRDFRILQVMDDNRPVGSGFYACSYQSPRGELVAAFRGSEMLGNRRYRNDYETDFALCYESQTPQQQRAEEYLETHDAFWRRPFTLTGHSLGGNLALYAAVRAPRPDLLTACHAFNAPGFCGEMLAENDHRIEAVRKKLYSIQNRHDMVSSLLIGIGEPVIIESLFQPHKLSAPEVADILYPHSNFMFRKENGVMVNAPEQKKDPLCGCVERVTRLFLRLPRFVRKRICELALDVIYSVQPPAKQLEFLLESVTRYLVVQGVESEHLAFGSGLYWARQMADGERTAQCYHKLYGGGLDVRQEVAEASILLFQLLRYGNAVGTAAQSA